MMWFLDILSLGLLSFAVTRFLIPLCILFANKYKILDIPDGVIKRQVTIVPYLGGVAVFCGFFFSSIFFINFSFRIFLFLCASLGLVILGLIDDIVVLRPLQKFVGQCLCTACYVYAEFYFNIPIFPLWFNVLFSFLWILTLINAFNLIDVMDGLATTVAMCASLCFLGLAIFQLNYTIAIIFACLFGALAAFLTYNFPPARMYLGDTGSMLLGGLLGALPLGLYSADIQSYVSYVIILAIPLIELVSLVIVRTYKGIPFYKGSPDHFSIYLLHNGWDKKSVLVYVFIMMCFLTVVSNLLLSEQITFVHVCVFTCIFLLVWIILIMVPKSFLSKVTF